MDPDILAQVLVQRGGYNPTDARNAASGPRAAELAQEFGVGSGPGGSLNPTEMILKAFTDRQNEVNRLTRQYQGKNPFVYDDVLAQKHQQAAEQLNPYYNKLLSDYLSGVQAQRGRSLEDQQRMLSELNQDVTTHTGQSQTNLQLALDKARQGSSDLGLYNSGQAQREQGLIQNQSNLGLQQYMTNAQRREQGINLDTTRTLQDIQREQNIRVPQIGREQASQTDILSSQLAREAGQKYAIGLNQYLGPAGALGAGNNNYDILKGII